MAITVVHSYVSGISDSGDSTLVQPSDWNDDHVVTGTVPSSQMTGSSFTAVNDTNVTLALTGDSSVALVNSATITAGWTGTLAPSRGGTGIGSYGVGDLLYASSSGALSALTATASGKVLISNGTSAAPSWSPNVALITTPNTTDFALNITQAIDGVSTEAITAVNRYFATDVLAAGAGNHVSWMDIYGSFGGSAFSGNRAGFAVNMGMNGPSTNVGTGSYIAISGAIVANSCDGGTSPSWPNNAGVFWGGYFLSNATSAAQNLRALYSVECDVANQSTSVELVSNMLYLRPTTNTQSGINFDCLEAWQSQAGSVKADYGMLAFGGNTFTPAGNEFPISSDGYIFGTLGASADTVGYGIDLSNIGTVTNYAFRSNNFYVAGSGNVNTNGSYLISSATVLFTSGNFLTLANNAGFGVSVGSSAVNQSYYDNTEQFFRGTGAALPCNTVLNGFQAVIATTAAFGFPYIPTSTGTPTGTPTAYTGNAAIVFDSGNNRLWINSTSGWRWITTSSS